MKCKVLVLTHGDLAEAFIRAVQLILGDVEKLQYKNLPLSLDIEKYKAEIEEILEDNQDTGVLILTDLLGGSPFLTCSQIIQKHWKNMELITGCNLQMLLAVASEIEDKGIEELKQIALESGRKGIVDLKGQVKEEVSA